MNSLPLVSPKGIPHRKPLRLAGYDYSQAGGYFVTIVTQFRVALFGKIEYGEMILNDAGKMVHSEWESLPKRFPNISVDEFQVMPNHFHGIIIIHNPVGGGPCARPGPCPRHCRRHSARP